MIYLDYSATTPVSLEVQDTINKVTREFIGNANSINGLGIKSKNLLNSATKQIAEEFNILDKTLKTYYNRDKFYYTNKDTYKKVSEVLPDYIK
mgnify:CR=1 FL=1